MPPKRSVEDVITEKVVELQTGDTKSSKSNSNLKAKKVTVKEDVGGIGVVDLLRVLTGLLVVAAGMSYIVTGGSYTWGYDLKTQWKKLTAMKSGPLTLTDIELLSYTGADPTLPIYVALNGTIYDVTAGRAFYGPGGSYSFFAGRDGARAFVTGCFDTDLTPDLRGVEEMFMPLSWEEAESLGREVDPKIKAAGPSEVLSKGKEKIRRESEMRHARKRVKDSLAHWEAMFKGGKGKDYFEVGKVKRPEGWEALVPVPKLCEQAKKQRPVRGAAPVKGAHV